MKTLLFLVTLVSSISAYERDDVVLSETITITNGKTLSLFSSGLLRYNVIFKGYVLGFYKENDNHAPLGDHAKQLTFHYFWDIKAKAFADAGSAHLKTQLTASERVNLKKDIDAFNKLYVNIKKGDRYHLRYIPGTGTQLFHNNRLLGTVKGYGFAKAYFGIWLGKKPLSDSLKAQLLTPLYKD